jgi:group I intron endonuclease
MTVAIYEILCLVNNKKYIGSSKNIERRFYKHKLLLNKNKHTNLFLQNSWNKHGEDNFKFSIIEICKIEDLINKECFYINKFNTFDKKFGFNVSKPSKVYDRSKTYLVITPNGEEVIVNNLESFCIKNNLEKSSLHKVANKKSRGHKGYLCKHIDESWEEWDKNHLRKNKSGPYNGKWKIIYTDDSIKIVISLYGFCKENKYNISELYKIINKKTKIYKNIKGIEKCI